VLTRQKIFSSRVILTSNSSDSSSSVHHFSAGMAPGLSEAVATAVLSRFNSLPKTGKPTAGEYTLLAGFAVSDEATPDVPPRVVALGTGTKCLPAARRFLIRTPRF
jgi:hypothetical protein